MKRAWLLLLCAACQRAPSASEKAQTQDAAQSTPVANKARCTEPRVAARVKERSGKLLGLRTGEGAEQVPVGTTLELSEGAALTLDWPQGARIAIAGPSIIATGRSERDQLLVKHGGLKVELPPGAVTARSGLLLVTPCASLQLVRGGALALRVLGDGLTAVQVVSGSALLLGTAEQVARTEALLTPGHVQRIFCGGRVERDDAAPVTLEQADKQLALLAKSRRSLQVELLDDGLLKTQAKLEAEQLHRDQLRTAHREAVPRNDGSAQRLQGEMAVHAEGMARLTQYRDALVEQRRAAGLGSLKGLVDPRVQGLLGEADPPLPCP